MAGYNANLFKNGSRPGIKMSLLVKIIRPKITITTPLVTSRTLKYFLIRLKNLQN
jgi:hypothetical protein